MHNLHCLLLKVFFFFLNYSKQGAKKHLKLERFSWVLATDYFIKLRNLIRSNFLYHKANPCKEILLLYSKN